MSDRNRVTVRVFAALRQAPQPDDWADDAACKGKAPTDGHSPHPFFPGHAALPPKWAVAMCAACPVREPCRAYALRWPVTGYWGGTSEKNRKEWRKSERRRAS